MSIYTQQPQHLIDVPHFEFVDQSSQFTLQDSISEVTETVNSNSMIQGLSDQSQADTDAILQASSQKWGSYTDLEDEQLEYRRLCQLVNDQGLICETHQTTTEDGYVLTMFRMTVPHMEKGSRVVFLQHGLFSDASTWIMHGSESLSVVLAKQGYDVWLGNNRGNIYSRKNTHYDPARDYVKFFDYSFYELGKYDAPAQIDYVLGWTGHDKLSYVGHSQGTSQMFSALSESQELNSKLDIFIACAPIVNLKNTQERMLSQTSSQWRDVYSTTKRLKIHEIRDPKLDQGLRDFCDIFEPICNALTKWFHLTSPYADQQAIDLQNSRPNTGSSTKQIMHYAQIIKNGVFRQFDYGNDNDNIDHYGSKIVPLIRLSQITSQIPLVLLVGKQDTLADQTDVAWLRRQLGRKVKMYKAYDQFDHFSFQIGKDMSYTQDVLALIEKYNPKNMGANDEMSTIY